LYSRFEILANHSVLARHMHGFGVLSSLFDNASIRATQEAATSGLLAGLGPCTEPDGDAVVGPRR